jgi:hypothetical protein
MLKAKKSGTVLRHEKAIKAITKVEKEHLTTRINVDNYKNLKLMSAHTGRPMGELLDRMIERESKEFFHGRK